MLEDLGMMQELGFTSLPVTESLNTSPQTAQAIRTSAGAVSVIATTIVPGPATLSAIRGVATQAFGVAEASITTALPNYTLE